LPARSPDTSHLRRPIQPKFLEKNDLRNRLPLSPGDNYRISGLISSRGEAEIVQEKEKARHFGEPVNFFKFVFLFLLFLI
jgi:hypothetical protein